MGTHPRAHLLLAVTLLAVAAAGSVTPSAAAPSSAVPSATSRPTSADTLSGRWDGDGPVRAGAAVHGRLVVRTTAAAADDLRVLVLTLTGARLTAIPRGCRSSVTLRIHSTISEDGRTLRCEVADAGRTRVVRFAAVVDPVGSHSVDAVVSSTRAPAYALGARPVEGRVAHSDGAEPEWRLLSSPDFLNADVADLTRGPNLWQPGRTANSTNAAYDTAIDHVLDDWEEQDPLEVLVAGDLVEGWWGTDAGGSGNFGPVDTLAHRRRAVVRAARTVYPQYYERFRAHHLDVRPAIGDHELGDDDWPREKRELAGTFRAEFARHATRTPSGGPRYADHPQGQHALTAYAWRPRPDLQLVSIDPFDITPGHARLRLDGAQLRWLHGVLRRAQADGVRWTLVQGHVPILGPVRVQGSSGLRYDRRAAPGLWRMFARYGVDAYLCGEVHDTTATERDGVTQLTHGGAFQFGLTTYLLLDRVGDHLRLTLRDYKSRWADAADRSRLWETRPGGLPKIVRVDPVPFTIGTADLTADGHLTDRSGILLPYDPRAETGGRAAATPTRSPRPGSAPTRPARPAPPPAGTPATSR